MTEEEIKKRIEERQKELDRVSNELVRVRDRMSELVIRAQQLQGAIAELKSLIELPKIGNP